MRISGGSYVVGSLVDGGMLTISRGSLSVTNPAVTSEFKVMRVHRGGRLLFAGVSDGGTLVSSGDVTFGESPFIVHGRIKTPPVVPCLVGYTPFHAVPDCMSPQARRAAEAAVRTTWRMFAALINTAASSHSVSPHVQQQLTSVLAGPRVCLLPGEVMPASKKERGSLCPAMIDHLVFAASQHPLSTTIANLSIDWSLAAGDAAGAAPVGFQRYHAGWRITQI
jgi:hypothetical protein